MGVYAAAMYPSSNNCPAAAVAAAASCLQAYCHNYGVCWTLQNETDKEEGERYKSGSPFKLSASLQWLLEHAGLQQLQQPMGECRTALLLSTLCICVQLFMHCGCCYAGCYIVM
jgi:hypothetical protein